MTQPVVVLGDLHLSRQTAKAVADDLVRLLERHRRRARRLRRRPLRHLGRRGAGAAAPGDAGYAGARTRTRAPRWPRTSTEAAISGSSPATTTPTSATTTSGCTCSRPSASRLASRVAGSDDAVVLPRRRAPPRARDNGFMAAFSRCHRVCRVGSSRLCFRAHRRKRRQTRSGHRGAGRKQRRDRVLRDGMPADHGGQKSRGGEPRLRPAEGRVPGLPLCRRIGALRRVLGGLGRNL